MIDHMNLPVSDITRSRSFYDAILECLNYNCIAEDGGAVGYGSDCWQFGIEQVIGDMPCLHIAFRASSTIQVDQFFSVAIENGASANGNPGYRLQYGSDYYAAFVLDPDNHNVEAVFRGPAGGQIRDQSSDL